MFVLVLLGAGVMFDRMADKAREIRKQAEEQRAAVEWLYTQDDAGEHPVVVIHRDGTNVTDVSINVPSGTPVKVNGVMQVAR